MMMATMTALFMMMSFSMMKKHILPMIMSMEMMMMANVTQISSIKQESNKTSTVMVMVVFMVAEGTTALSMLVMFTKTKGNELMMMSKW